MLGAVEYPLRPAAWRGWGGRQPPCRCYLPPSWPVYRLQRVVSAALCLLAVLLLCLLALVLLQAAPASPRVWGGQGEVGVPRLAGPGLGGVEDEDYSDSGLDEYEDEEDEELVMSEDYEDEDGHDYEDNPEFDMSYFDFSIKEGAAGGGGGAGPPPPRQQQVDEAAASFSTPALRGSWSRLTLPPRRLMGRGGMEVVRDGVLFSPQVEARLKDKGFSDTDVGRLLWQLRRRDVAELRDPSWERCGRPKNQWLRLAGGAAACARYRYPDDHLLLGEVLSFYLARLLGVGRVPPATLARPDHPRWAAVAPQMERAGWGAAPVVVLTPWLTDLVRDHMPLSLHHAVTTNTTLGLPTEEEEEEEEEEEAEGEEDKRAEGRRAEEEENWGAVDERRMQAELRSEGGGGAAKRNDGVGKGGGKVEEGKGGMEGGRITPPSLQEASEEELVRLLQWSELLVFDFLTGNYDRVAYMMDAAEGEEGRPEVLKGTVHNLVRNRATDGLWLLDNESGLVDGYNLLYGRGDPAQATRFASFHTRLLRATCVFRRATVEAVMALSAHPRPHELLVEFARENEPLFALLPDPLQEDRFLWRLSDRLQEVRAWMMECARRAARTMQRRGRGEGV